VCLWGADPRHLLPTTKMTTMVTTQATSRRGQVAQEASCRYPLPTSISALESMNNWLFQEVRGRLLRACSIQSFLPRRRPSSAWPWGCPQDALQVHSNCARGRKVAGLCRMRSAPYLFDGAPHRRLELPPGSVQQPVCRARRPELSGARSGHGAIAFSIPASRDHRRAPSCLLSSMRGCLIRTPSMTTTMVCFQPPPLERERPWCGAGWVVSPSRRIARAPVPAQC